jgi:hypothetical protein
MCFEFEALYWAKLAEEEESRKAAIKKAAEQEQQRGSREASNQIGYDEEPLPI